VAGRLRTEPDRIGSGSGQLNIVIKGNVFIPGSIADHPGQGSFTALARPMDQYHRGIFQRLL